MTIEFPEDGSAVSLTGNQIRHVREVLGEGQRQFARRFGVQQPSVHRWESKGDKASTGPEIILIHALATRYKIAIPPVPVADDVAEEPVDGA